MLAAARGSEGVLVAQTDDEFRVVPVRAGKVVAAVIALVPDEKPGPGGAARLPRQVFDDAIDEYQRTGYVGLERTLTAGGGISGRDLRTVITLVESARHGGGQLAANSLDTMGRRSRTPVVNWFDTAAGRYLAHVELAAGQRRVADDRPRGHRPHRTTPGPAHRGAVTVHSRPSCPQPARLSTAGPRTPHPPPTADTMDLEGCPRRGRGHRITGARVRARFVRVEVPMCGGSRR